MSKIELTIRYAVLKKNHDTVGKMENYVKVTLHSNNRTSEFKTKIVEGDKNTNIIWNQTLVILYQPSPQLYL